MAGGASGFGAFAGGLWSGAASAMQLARAYQQYKAQSAYSDAADAVADAQKEAQGVDTSQPAAAPPAAPPAPGDTTQAATTTAPAATGGGDGGDTSQPAPTTTTDKGPVKAAPTKGVVAKPTQAITPPKLDNKKDQDAFNQTYAEALASESARIHQKEVATGAQTDLGSQTPAPPEAKSAPMNQALPGQTAGVQGAPGTPSGAAVVAPPSGTTEYGPYVPPPPNAVSSQSPALSTTLFTPPHGTPVQGPGVPSAQEQQAGTGLPMVSGAPMQAAGTTTSDVTGTTRPAPPAPGQTPDWRTRTLQRHGIPATSAPGTPTSQAEPPQSATDRILTAAGAGPAPGPASGPAGRAPAPGAVGSDVSAIQQGIQQAQAQPGAATGVAAAGPAAPTDTPPAPQPMATKAVNQAIGGDQPITAPHAPVVAPTAQPTERQATALPPRAGPVAVAAKAAPVAPDQKTPTKQSEQSPPAGPPIGTSAWNQISKTEQAYLIKVAHEDGQDKVTAQQLAETWKREGGLKYSVPNGAAGEVGPFQVKPGTQHGIGADDLNASSFADGARLSARYYAHLADVGYPVGSPAQSAAYMAGETGARNYNNLQPNQQGWLKDMYPGFDPGKDSWSNLGPTGRSDLDTHTQIVNAGHLYGPNGTLQAVVDSSPAGIPLSQKWRIAEAAMTRAMIMNGHPEAVGQVQEWVAQQAHQGALSNLYAGWQALRGGSAETAANFFAKAHAFFPDGTFAQFGVDKDHNVWAQQIDENTHAKIGTPFQVTANAVQEEMTRLQHPNNFMDKLMDMRAKVAEIQLHQAQTGYYMQRPALQEAAIGERTRHDEALEAGTAEARAQREQTHADSQADRALTRQNQEESAIQRDRGAVDKAVDKDYGEDGSEQLPKGGNQDTHDAQQGIERALRYPTRAGGSGMSSGAARTMAKDVMSGKRVLSKDPQTGHYGVYDKDDTQHANPRGAISDELGDALVQLPGMARRPGAALAPPAGTRPQAAIGAGAGTAYAMGQPGTNTYGGVATIPLPQQQEQPSMAA